jgi:polyphosphate kinase 2 (PPK2 family)
MLDRTDPPWAPWHVVPGDSKHYARLIVVETVCAAVEDELTRRGIPAD